MFNLIWLIPTFPLLAFVLIILVTHDPEVATVAKKIIRLRDGLIESIEENRR